MHVIILLKIKEKTDKICGRRFPMENLVGPLCLIPAGEFQRRKFVVQRGIYSDRIIRRLSHVQ